MGGLSSGLRDGVLGMEAALRVNLEVSLEMVLGRPPPLDALEPLPDGRSTWEQ